MRIKALGFRIDDRMECLRCEIWFVWKQWGRVHLLSVEIASKPVNRLSLVDD
jgi:hypothetical protein